ncbi:MAG TPA: 6-carboxytetrahydropterin synthase [Longimicrobiales bacterium]|nr:6-carboxytetrahydropterin synthase [Longimicrobiales bacterium]
MARSRIVHLYQQRFMARVKVTRRVHFCAAHRLGRDDWSQDQNLRVFGSCANPNWHGHNYELDVTVEGEVDPATGFVFDLKHLRELVESRVLADVDHRNLNLDVPWLEDLNPTTENLVVAVWHRLAGALPEGIRLVRLVLWETPRNYVEYTGG